MKRITRDNLYTNIALEFSKRSTCSRLQVGCVITKDGRVVSSGYNGPLGMSAIMTEKTGMCSTCDYIKPCTKSIHSEANAIAYSAKNGIPLEGTIMYVTHSPCIKCAELIIQSGIIEVIYLEPFRDNSGLQLLIDNKIAIRKYEES